MIHHDVLMIQRVISGCPQPIRHSYLARERQSNSGPSTTTMMHDLFSSDPIGESMEQGQGKNQMAFSNAVSLIRFTNRYYAPHRIPRLMRYIDASFVPTVTRPPLHPDSKQSIMSLLVKLAFQKSSFQAAKSVLARCELAAPYATLISLLCFNSKVSEAIACKSCILLILV